MNYQFLNKAKSEPDLSDFCEYLNKPLEVLTDIQKRYQSLEAEKRLETNNISLNHKIDVILKKHLPKMVEDYCNFSFDYRNKKKFKIGNSSVTPKELLLKNLSKVIEEIEVIEEEFNKNNFFNVAAHNKVLNDFGHQPQVCLEKHEIVNNKIQLDNKFNYEEFVERTQFKENNNKFDYLNDDEALDYLLNDDEPIDYFEDNIEVDEIDFENFNSESSNFTAYYEDEKIFDKYSKNLIDGQCEVNPIKIESNTNKKQSFFKSVIYQEIQNWVLIFFCIMSMFGILISMVYLSFYSNKKYIDLEDNIQTIIDNSFILPEGNGKILVKKDLSKNDIFVTPWKTKISLEVASINKSNDSILIHLPLPQEGVGNSCQKMFALAKDFDMVKVDNLIVKKDNIIDYDRFMTTCQYAGHENVSLIKQVN